MISIKTHNNTTGKLMLITKMHIYSIVLYTYLPRVVSGRGRFCCDHGDCDLTPLVLRVGSVRPSVARRADRCLYRRPEPIQREIENILVVSLGNVEGKGSQADVS